MADYSAEICCSACGKDVFVIREPKYENFTHLGDFFRCAGCGHLYESEAEVPFKREDKAEVFTDTDRSDDTVVFDEGEADRLCRHCIHYVVNPFMQWCGHHAKEVEATDTCPRFKQRPPEKVGDSDDEESGPSIF